MSKYNDTKCEKVYDVNKNVRFGKSGGEYLIFFAMCNIRKPINALTYKL